MARFRRAMAIIWTHGFVDGQTLAAQMDCSRTNAERIVASLRDCQFLKQIPGNSARDKTALSLSMEGQKQKEFMKWFSGGHLDYRI